MVPEMRITKALPVLLMLSLLTSCCPYCKRAKKETKTFRFNSVFGDLPSFHPHIATDMRARSLEKAVFEGLTRLNEKGVPEPAGAQKIDISSCKKIYTFYLRPHKWSNGQLVTAYDYELTWKHALSPGADCDMGNTFISLKMERRRSGEKSLYTMSEFTL